MLCGSCTRWECLPEDLFCSFCGHPAKRLEVLPPAAVFVGGGRAKPLRMSLANRGTSPLRVRIGQPRTTREWLKITHPALANDAERKRVGWTKAVAAVEDGKALPYPFIDAEVTLPAGAEYGFDVVVDGRLATPERDLGDVLLLAGEGLTDLRGNPVAVRRVAVSWGVTPEPRVAVPPEVNCSLGAKASPFEVRLHNTRRGFLTLREPPRANAAWVRVVSFPEEPVRPGEEAAIQLACDPDWAPPGTHKVEVTIPVMELEKPLTATVSVSVRLPPQLLLNRTRITFNDLTPYSEATLTFTLENRGEEDLLLLGEPTIEPAAIRKHLKIRDDDPTHRRIKSVRDGHRGKTISVVASGRGLNAGELSGTIRVATNDPGQPTAEIAVALAVKPMPVCDRLLALDFGTSNCCIAVAYDAVRQDVLDLSGGARERLTELPTVIYFRGPNDHVVGEEAKNSWLAHADRTVSSIKRRLGSKKPVKILGREYTPGQIASLIIRKLWERAAVALSSEPRELVLTVPCHFGRDAIDTLLSAAREAGFEPRPEPRYVLDEPSAAAYRYLVLSRDELVARGAEHRVLVYDFGGGTLDIALLEVRFRDHPLTYIRVIDVDGLDLGGDDLDEDIQELYVERMVADQRANAKSKLARLDLDRILEEVEGEGDLNILHNRTTLKLTAEAVKKKLSSEKEVPLPNVLLKDRFGGLVYLDATDTFMTLKRSDFEAKVKPRLERANDQVRRLLERSRVDAGTVSTLLLTGGSSRMPLVREMVSKLVPKAVAPSHEEIPPKESVALGAVIYGYLGRFAMSEDPDVVIEGLRERAFYSIGTLTQLGKFHEILARGPLPLFGEFPLRLPPQPMKLPLVRNNGATDPRFMEMGAMPDIGVVTIDPREFPETKPGATVTLELFLYEDRRLVAKIGPKELPVELREGALA